MLHPLCAGAGGSTWGMELMTGAFRVAQGMVATIMDSSGLTAMSATTLPDELVSVIEDVGFIDSIPLWAVTLLGSLLYLGALPCDDTDGV